MISRHHYTHRRADPDDDRALKLLSRVTPDYDTCIMRHRAAVC